MTNSFFEIVELIAETESETQFLSKEDAYISYEKPGRKTPVSFYRLTELESNLRNTYPEYEFAVYHSNQYQEFFSEVEIYAKKEGKALLVTFHTDEIEKYKLTYSLTHVDQQERGFGVVEKEHLSFFPSFNEWLTPVFTHIQTLPAYRLHFATGTIELEEDLW